jgi:hypothetical protein
MRCPSLLEMAARYRQHRAMKKQTPFVFAFVAAVFLAGCAMFREEPQNSLVGTWVNPLGTVWAVKADGTFEVAFNNTNRPTVWGKYSVADDTITLTHSHGFHVPKSCRAKATYKFIRDQDTLTFTKVSDRCKLREKNVLLPWKPWKGK